MDCSTPGFPVLHCLLDFSDSCPLSRWCHPTISPSLVPFSSCPQSFPALGSFPVPQLFTSGGQRMELQHQSFQWIFSVDFLLEGLVWPPRSPSFNPPPHSFGRTLKNLWEIMKWIFEGMICTVNWGHIVLASERLGFEYPACCMSSADGLSL